MPCSSEDTLLTTWQTSKSTLAKSLPRIRKIPQRTTRGTTTLITDSASIIKKDGKANGLSIFASPSGVGYIIIAIERILYERLMHALVFIVLLTAWRRSHLAVSRLCFWRFPVHVYRSETRVYCDSQLIPNLMLTFAAFMRIIFRSGHAPSPDGCDELVGLSPLCTAVKHHGMLHCSHPLYYYYITPIVYSYVADGISALV